MIKGIKTKTTTKFNGNPDIVKKIKEIMRQSKHAYVTIGFHSDAGKYTEGSNPPDVIEVALWNEFGTKHTPERSFIRTAIDENAKKIENWRDEALSNMILGNWDLKKSLNFIGFNIQVLIQNKIKSNVQPANAPSTQAQKIKDGVGTNTLMHTQLMLRSVTYKVHT